MSARIRLRRGDGRVFLDRWGIESKRWGGIFLHRMSAPDPGVDLHDHPWTFVSLVLLGGYREERTATRTACLDAQRAEAEEFRLRQHHIDEHVVRGSMHWRDGRSIKTMRLDECHRIVGLFDGGPCWTLVLHGPHRRTWGFYTADGWEPKNDYATSERGYRRDLHNDIGADLT